jgi:hypothetical protein
MRKTLQLFGQVLKTILIIIRRLPFLTLNMICVKALYWLTYENGDIDGTLTKRKYRRIKQSIRYKLWLWYNMKWLCNLLNYNFSCYEPYHKNKKILRY